LVARDPCRLGKFQLGFGRLGVYTAGYERRISQVDRLLYRRVMCWFTAEHGTTGWHEPTWTEQVIYGVLVERGSRMPGFAAGVVAQLDAVLILMDGVKAMDQIRDPLNGRVYEVQGEPEERMDPASGGFAYRVCQLHYLPFTT
jgi:hypothetical protein